MIFFDIRKPPFARGPICGIGQVSHHRSVRYDGVFVDDDDSVMDAVHFIISLRTVDVVDSDSAV